jgi:hypothetical protein
MAKVERTPYGHGVIAPKLFIDECSDMEIAVSVRRPPKKDRGFKKAHSLTNRQAWAAVLRDPKWHPQSAWTPAVEDDDIPF